MNDTGLESILKKCTNRGNNPVCEKEKMFEDLWQKQQKRLAQHDKYIAESIEIQPIPVFVCKAVMRQKDQSVNESQKVFLNICSHHLVPNLSISEIDLEDSGERQKGIRFPMSCGPQIKVKDNKGNDASSFDVVLHPDVIKYALNDDKYKMNICVTAAQNISQKQNIIITKPYKFPKCIYKGIDEAHKQPLTQRIRKKGAAKFVQEDDALEYAPKTESPKEIKCTSKKQNAEQQIILKHNFYIIFNDNNRKKLLIENMGKLRKYLNTFEDKEKILNEITAIQIHLNVTKRLKLKDLDLNTNKDGICLKFNGKLLFQIQWNTMFQKMSRFVNSDRIVAKFIKKKCLLKLMCPLSKD